MTPADALPILLPLIFGAGFLARGWLSPSVGAQRIAETPRGSFSPFLDDRPPPPLPPVRRPAPTSADLLAGQVSGLAVEIGALASAVDRQTDAMERSMKLALEGAPQ